MLYSVVLKNLSIITDFSEDEGDFQEVLFGVFKANRNHMEFYEISYLHYAFYFLHKEEYTFACITNQNVDQEKVLFFLSTLKQSFYEILQKERDHFTLKLTNTMRDLMGQYKEEIREDKFERVEHELREIESQKFNILKQTLDKEMALDSLITKSDSLKQDSFHLKYQVRRTLQKVKKSYFQYYLTGFLFLLIIFVFFFYRLTFK